MIGAFLYLCLAGLLVCVVGLTLVACACIIVLVREVWNYLGGRP